MNYLRKGRSQLLIFSLLKISIQSVLWLKVMEKGSREEMEEEARQLGARIQKAVSGKTAYLVCGEKVGARKIEKARQLGVTVISEKEYLKIVQDDL